MSIGSRSRRLGSLLVGAALLALIAGCSSAPAGPSSSASGAKPTVTIQSPANGAVVAVGQTVAITGSASDTVGVDHVALFADGVSFASTPSGTPAPTVPFSLNWLATPAGPHILQVLAYRADGTASDPAVINLVVGAGGSGVVGSLTPLPPVGLPTLPPPPKPTKKPKPPKTPPPATTEPTTPPSTTPTDAPTQAPTAAPTGTPLPTAAADGTAPDDTATEPHQIVIDPANVAMCPAADPAIPVSAVGCIWGQISAPAGDTTDTLFYVPLANTDYHLGLSSCSDTSDTTEWFTPPKDQNTLATGCGDFLGSQVGPTAPAQSLIQVDFNQPPAQTYNLYEFTVYQCTFANCGSQ